MRGLLRLIVVFCCALFIPLAYAEEDYSSDTPPKITKHRHHGHSKAKGVHNVFPEQKSPTGSRIFIFSPRAHAWAVYDEEGKRVNTGRASGGKGFCPDIHRACRTIVGTFHVLSKGGISCKSKIYPRPYGGAPMPYCMRFSEMGYAIHGSNSVPSHNASHGCIRVVPSDARWLSQNFMRVGTTVVVLPY